MRIPLAALTAVLVGIPAAAQTHGGTSTQFFGSTCSSISAAAPEGNLGKECAVGADTVSTFAIWDTYAPILTAESYVVSTGAYRTATAILTWQDYITFATGPVPDRLILWFDVNLGSDVFVTGTGGSAAYLLAVKGASEFGRGFVGRNVGGPPTPTRVGVAIFPQSSSMFVYSMALSATAQVYNGQGTAYAGLGVRLGAVSYFQGETDISAIVDPTFGSDEDGHSYRPARGGSGVLLTPVPEPATVGLLAIGLVGLSLAGWRRR